MKKYISNEVLAQTMNLRKLGARIQSVNTKMCYVKFEINGLQIEYAYGVNTTGRYFLERTKPYPLPLREFTEEARLIDIIEIDLDQFITAHGHRDIQPFIEASKDFHRIFQRFEDLYLYYDVPSEKLEAIHQKLEEIDTLVREAAGTSERIYMRKDSDLL